MTAIALEIDEQKIGQYLLRTRSLTRPTLDRALAIQAELPFLRLGEILVGLKAVTFQQFMNSLYRQCADTLLGHIMVRRGYASTEQVEKALELQASRELPLPLGEILVAVGVSSPDQVEAALVERQVVDEYRMHLTDEAYLTPPPGFEADHSDVSARRLGQLLLNAGVVSEDALTRALAIQTNLPFMRIGEILMGLEGLAFKDLLVARYQQFSDTRLGHLMIERGFATPGQIEEALVIQANEPQHRRLGEILVAHAIAKPSEIEAALAERKRFDEYKFRLLLNRYYEETSQATPQPGAVATDELARFETYLACNQPEA